MGTRESRSTNRSNRSGRPRKPRPNNQKRSDVDKRIDELEADRDPISLAEEMAMLAPEQELSAKMVLPF